MKTKKRTFGMPAKARYIVRHLDPSSKIGDSYSSKPIFSKTLNIWQTGRTGMNTGEVFIGNTLKPGEIVKIID